MQEWKGAMQEQKGAMKAESALKAESAMKLHNVDLAILQTMNTCIIKRYAHFLRKVLLQMILQTYLKYSKYFKALLKLLENCDLESWILLLF